MSSFIYKCMIITAVIVAFYIHESEATTNIVLTVSQGLFNILQQMLNQLGQFINDMNNDLSTGIVGIGTGVNGVVQSGGTLATNAGSNIVQNQ